MATKSKRRTGLKHKWERLKFEEQAISHITIFTPVPGGGYIKSEEQR